ncbi:hypothetical protein [Neobacillus vireti]|uniref:Zinc finger CHC2-type domain-containing protein n=1 Tax=Neobacillus vireti LMG 21834 TaxID=1131730 RepID=A0AB94ILF4_9BACI|nr:hypothetical protein [Neobacillus vireti]ETI67857.1 hypothetical protein BAVI_15251 [Neobacillus vireti LMG 21834]KLT16131.1 hypothetical protein AA980_19395 [Neobacillus vireti]
MGKKLQAIAFFKARKIDYYYDSKKMVIAFPCPSCDNKTEMSAVTTDWSCDICGENGNLATLISIPLNIDSNINGVKIYNPKKEWSDIKRKFTKLSKRHGNDVDTLFERVRNLVNHYEENK